MMKLFRILGRNIRDAFRSVFRNFSLSIASISCISITLIIVAVSILSSYNVDNFTKIVKADFTIIAFLDNNLGEEKTNVLEEQISQMSNIESVTFQDKRAVASEMMKDSDVFKNIMGNWSDKENPLQDTFLIKVADTNKISATANELKKIEGISLIRYGEGMVEQLLSVFRIVQKALVVVVLLLVFVTAFLIANTIKLTIFSRRKEIEIMRLVGASNINIEVPFIIEGLFLGLLGAIIPVILVIYGYTAIFLSFNGKIFSPFVRLVTPEPFIYIVSLIIIGLGIVVGMIGSLKAVRKYLKI